MNIKYCILFLLLSLQSISQTKAAKTSTLTIIGDTKTEQIMVLNNIGNIYCL